MLTSRRLSFKQFVIKGPNSIRISVAEIRKEPKSNGRGDITKKVSEILSAIRGGGDAEVIRFARKFDGSKFRSFRDFFVSQKEIKEAYSKLTLKEIKAIKKSYEQIRWLAKMQMQRFLPRNCNTSLGYVVTEKFIPLSRIGGYIPGGLASYPSTVLMICGTAIEAGVKEIVLATPCSNGILSPAVLVAADICGVDEIIKVGGVQAIGALAYGTKSIKKVELIAGPGNEFVTEAKRQVESQRAVAIDTLAGPTELLIIADDSADERLVFEDLMSQAEHGNRTLCGVVTNSNKMINSIVLRANETGSRKRFDKLAQAILFTVKVSSLDQAVEFAQALAPEHVEILVSKPIAQSLTKSGLILEGSFAPCSASDYIVGTNHILPTGGTASRSSGLSVETFTKRMIVVRGSRAALRRSVKYISQLATLEGLPNHAMAAESRFSR
jgi:histidinol dehydrogenase